MPAPVIPGPIPQFHDIPQSGQPKAEFDPKADDFLGNQLPDFVTFMNGWTTAANDIGTFIGDAAAATYSAANDYGEWSELSGPLNMPAMVRHGGEYWVLQQNMPEVSSVEPGTDPAYWAYIFDVFGVAYVDVGSGATLLTTGDVATPADYLAATAGRVLTADGVWSAAVPVVLTSGATVAINMAAGTNFRLTPGVACTLSNPTGAKPGQSGTIDINNAGAHVIGLDTDYVFSGSAPDLSAAGRYLLAYQVLHDGKIFVTSNGVS